MKDSKGNNLFVRNIVKLTSDMFKLYESKFGFPVLDELAVIKEIDVHKAYPLSLSINGKVIYALPYEVVKSI